MIPINQPNKRRRWRRIGLWIGVSIVLLVAILFGAFKKLDYPPSKEALAAMTSDALADVAENSSYISFTPHGETKSPAVLFYPGGLVDERAYAPFAHELAGQGYPVYIIRMPFDLAVLGGNRADSVINDAPDGTYVIGGHSLGGVMASRYAAAHADKLKGVFYFASYPDPKGSLAGTDLSALDVTATKDGVLNRDAWKKAQPDLPHQVQEVVIEGGNHSGFGSYGQQKGDGQATITQAEQRNQIVGAMVKWLANIENNWLVNENSPGGIAARAFVGFRDGNRAQRKQVPLVGALAAE